MDAPTRYRFLRIGALIIGAVVCTSVLWHAYARLPWLQIFLLGAIAAVLRLRPVPILRDLQGNTIFAHIPGESVLLIALLRHGPEAALAVSAVTNALGYTFGWRSWLAIPAYRLGGASNLVYLPSLAYLFGTLYIAFGGHLVRTVMDCALVFQQPTAVILPLIGATLLAYEGVNRIFQSLSLNFGRGVPLRMTLTDFSLGIFEHVESLGALLGLVSWTTWGWGTLPFSLFLSEALLLSAREHYARRDADADPVTGLISARGLSRAIQRCLGGGASGALLFLDMDNFKRVNDELGHTAGDALLRLVGQTLRAQVRTHDVVGRRGGDEFIVVLQGVGRRNAEQALERLRQAVARAIAETAELAPMAVGFSAGLAMFPEDGRDEATLFNIADRSMYADKRDRKSVAAGVR